VHPRHTDGARRCVDGALDAGDHVLCGCVRRAIVQRDFADAASGPLGGVPNRFMLRVMIVRRRQDRLIAADAQAVVAASAVVVLGVRQISWLAADVVGSAF
jgi:hypothetical protein